MKAEIAVRSAPGKVILLGEHTVVYGKPAIAASIRPRLELTVAVGDAPGVESSDARVRVALETAAAAYGIDPRRIGIAVESEIPIGCGLGSSAAFSVALLRALGTIAGRELAAAELLRRATEVENAFHGTSSGIDVAIATLGGAIWFERPPGGVPQAKRLPVHDAFDLVVSLSDERRSTAGPVGRLRERVRSHPGLYGQFFELAGNLVHAGKGALATGDFETLGLVMDAAHGLLNSMGVSTPTLERMTTLARRAGALGAKLTGAGGGGAIVALAPETAHDVADALRAEGFETFVTRVGDEAGADETSDRAEIEIEIEEEMPDAGDQRAVL